MRVQHIHLGVGHRTSDGDVLTFFNRSVSRVSCVLRWSIKIKYVIDGRLLVDFLDQRILERFAGETFGLRAGAPLLVGDASVEGALAERGVDAYHATFSQYLFCCVCDFQGGFLTVLSNQLWASEIIRRARSALENLRVEVTRPA